MQKRISSFWELITADSLPSRLLITHAPENLYELVRTCLRPEANDVEHITLTQLRDHLASLSNIDLFAVPKINVITGTPTTSQLVLLNQYDERLPAADKLWLITTANRISLSWPTLTYHPPQLNDLKLLLKSTSENINLLYATIDLHDPLCLIQLVQQAKLGLTLSQTLCSPLEGSCWDILQKIFKLEGNLDLSIDQITQLTFALEMIHQAASSPAAASNIYLPPPFKHMLQRKDFCEKIDKNLLGFYQNILQSLLSGSKTHAQHFTRLWIKALALQVRE